MKTTGNTILITGGGTGIGRGLAEAFHALGNQVIISGRRRAPLDETTKANPGMRSLAGDMADPAAIRTFAARLAQDYPSLNVLINNAGIMRPENLLAPAHATTSDSASAADSDISVATITTNLLGPLRLTAALLPLLQKQPRATVMNVTSGLAFVPLAVTPTYCATKAALHSYTQSLRHQLRDTTVEVLELIPPYVATELMGSHQATDPHAMPLADFIAEVMEILTTRPNATEIAVKRVHPLRFAADGGQQQYKLAFMGLNQRG